MSFLAKIRWEKLGMWGALALGVWGVKSCRETEACNGQGPLGLEKLNERQTWAFAGIIAASLVALVALARRPSK